MEALFGSTQAKAGEQKSNSFDVNSFVGSITSSSHTNHSSGIKKDVPQNHSKPQPKNPVSSQNTAKSTPKSSNHDAEKSRDSKDSQRGRDGYPGDSKAHKKESHSKESSHNDKGNTRPRHEDYSPLGGNSDKGGHDRSYGQHDSSFEGKIKKKPVENNEDDSFKIKKNPNAQPSSPKIKKVESSIPKKPEISKPKANPSPSHQTSVNTSMNKSSTQHSSSQGPSRDRPVSSHKSDRPNGSIPKKPLNGATQSSSKIPQRPPSSSPGPSKSLGTKPLPNGVKPANKSIPQKPSSMNSSTQKPSGVRPVPPKSTSPRPPVKPGSASTNGKPNSSQPMVKKPVPGGPPPAKPRPNSSQPPKPVPPGRTAPPGGLSQEALRKQKEEKMRREAAAKAKGPVTGGSNLVKRPMGNPPPSRLEPQVQKKPKTAQEQKMALNTVFKGSAKPRHRGYAGSDDDDYEKDSFIDDGEDEEEDEEAQRELGQMFHIYRDKAKKSKPFENDIDDMEVGYERIVREEKWSAKIARMEDEKELELIKKEQEDELKRQQKRKKKLQVED